MKRPFKPKVDASAKPQKKMKLILTKLKHVPPILPRPGGIARVVIKDPPPLRTLTIDCGSQTGPQVKRTRASASRQSQTDGPLGMRSMGTGTPGLFPLIPLRKRCAETQTKRLRISTQTQTPVVTKRKRCSRKKQSASTETQTSALKDKAPSPHLDFLNYFDSNEVHSHTQTDPNPFFGIHKDSLLCDLDVLFTEAEGRGARSLASAETQTVVHSGSPDGKLGPALCFRTARETPDRELDSFDNYMETMDSETQTGSFSFGPIELDKLLLDP